MKRPVLFFLAILLSFSMLLLLLSCNEEEQQSTAPATDPPAADVPSEPEEEVKPSSLSTYGENIVDFDAIA